MTQSNRNVTSRRQLLRGGLRAAALGVLGAGSAGVVIKNHRRLREGRCVQRGMCTRCGVFQDCGLPRALSVRRALGESAHG